MKKMIGYQNENSRRHGKNGVPCFLSIYRLMRIENIDGEYFFRAIYKLKEKDGWKLSDRYFKNKEEAGIYFSQSPQVFEFCWPVDIKEEGYCFFPDNIDK